MKPISIYNALGIVEMASQAEARCALRRLLRHCYKRTRDNLGTTEESLRFYNQASQILNNDERRDLYDIEWNLAKASANERIAHVLDEAADGARQPLTPGKGGAQLTGVLDVSPESAKDQKPLELLPTNYKVSPAPAFPTLTPTLKVIFQAPKISEISPDADDEARTRPPTQKQTIPRQPEADPEPTTPSTQQYHPVLTESIALARTPIAQGLGAGMILFVLFALLYVSWGYVTRPFQLEQAWIWLPVLALGFLVVTLGFQRPATRIRDSFHLMTVPNEEAVKGWRRRGTIFLGSNHLSEDPSWVFQLRLAELERGRLQRTTLVAPWRRGAARLFDYALWGWFLIFPLFELARQEIISPRTLELIENPLVAPVLITFTWVPVEALLTAAVGTTLGKWLFGIYVQFKVSDPYASRSSDACWGYALARAFRVWWQGIGLGLPPILAFTAARAAATLARYEETEWDSDLDALVTWVPMKSYIQGLGLIGLAALSFLYVASWQAQIYALAHLDSDSAIAFISPERSKREPVKPALTPPTDNSIYGVPAPDSDENTKRWASFRSEILNASEESKMLLERKDWQRAFESCVHWAQLEITNPAPLRCQGKALQNLGRHREAINAFRRAKIYAPEDLSLDEAIQISQDAVFRQMNQ